MADMWCFCLNVCVPCALSPQSENENEGFGVQGHPPNRRAQTDPEVGDATDLRYDKTREPRLPT